VRAHHILVTNRQSAASHKLFPTLIKICTALTRVNTLEDRTPPGRPLARQVSHDEDMSPTAASPILTRQCRIGVSDDQLITLKMRGKRVNHRCHGGISGSTLMLSGIFGMLAGSGGVVLCMHGLIYMLSWIAPVVICRP
jgi:hypothetical protein